MSFVLPLLALAPPGGCNPFSENHNPSGYWDQQQRQPQSALEQLELGSCGDSGMKALRQATKVQANDVQHAL